MQFTIYNQFVKPFNTNSCYRYTRSLRWLQSHHPAKGSNPVLISLLVLSGNGQTCLQTEDHDTYRTLQSTSVLYVQVHKLKHGEVVRQTLVDTYSGECDKLRQEVRRLTALVQRTQSPADTAASGLGGLESSSDESTAQRTADATSPPVSAAQAQLSKVLQYHVTPLYRDDSRKFFVLSACLTHQIISYI